VNKEAACEKLRTAARNMEVDDAKHLLVHPCLDELRRDTWYAVPRQQYCAVDVINALVGLMGLGQRDYGDAGYEVWGRGTLCFMKKVVGCAQQVLGGAHVLVSRDVSFMSFLHYLAKWTKGLLKDNLELADKETFRSVRWTLLEFTIKVWRLMWAATAHFSTGLTHVEPMVTRVSEFVVGDARLRALDLDLQSLKKTTYKLILSSAHFVVPTKPSPSLRLATWLANFGRLNCGKGVDSDKEDHGLSVVLFSGVDFD